MKKVSGLFVLMFYCSFCFAQMANDTLQARIVLVGDAGQFTPDGRHPVVASVKKNIKLDAKTTVIYLGDNLYPEGLPDDQYKTYPAVKAALDTQVNIAKGTKAKVYFIPGNHDWAEFNTGGWEAVIRQQNYIEGVGDANVKFYPNDGCPGPVTVNISKDVVLIMMDSQWWLHQYEKPGIESDCPYKTKLEVLNELDNLLDQNSKKLVILAMHHPLKSNGIHGGYFGLKQGIFPLTEFKSNLYIPFPLIGFIYPIARGVFGTPQDLKHPVYADMIQRIQEVVRPHKNVIFVAGHEHNQQLIRDSGYYYIVSGAGSKHARVSQPSNSLFASDTTGFATLEISTNKNVDVSFYNVDDSVTKRAYHSSLMNFNTLEKEDPYRMVYIPFNADSITIAANPRYAKASALKRLFNGDNYRKEWATPVKMKIFYLKKMGMTIESLGGGRQTKTLSLKDKNGKKWILRTVDKDLEKLLPDDFRGNQALSYLRDFVSTAHPYAPLIVPPLADATGIVAAKPRLFFVPNDGALGLYRPLFANKVAMLEEKEPTPDGGDTKSTSKMLNKMIDDNDHHLEQPEMLKARLLDVMLADWDRHFDQWRFGETDTGKGKLYYPIPRDRDEALAYSNGLIVKLLAINTMPYLKGFTPAIQSFKWMSYEARDFDRLFLNSLTQNDWKEVIKDFQEQVTDAVIHKAVMQFPPEVYAVRGPYIENVLRSRRDQLMKQGLKYYRYLAKNVDIRGSNDKELYKVSKAGNGIQVRVYERKRNIDSVSVVYNRQFFDDQTNEIRFYGLGKDDFFEVDEDVSSKIKLRIVGGKGDDTFNMKGNIKNVLYDFNQDSNFVVNGNKSKIEFSDDVDINEYSYTGNEYNQFSFPLIHMGYNDEDGFIAGAGLSRRTYGFRKTPFASDQRLTALYAFAKGALRLKYDGEFVNVFGKSGLMVNANFAKPVLNNFFGFGNNTTINKDISNGFNEVRYNYADAQVLLTKRHFRNVITIGAGPRVFHYWNEPEDNSGKILGRPGLAGFDSLSIYKPKTYAGAKLIGNIKTLNNELFPTRGVLINTEINALAAVKNAKPFTSATADITLFSSFSGAARYLHVLRMGWGHIFSNNYEYFQAMDLGQNNVLRGYRKNRFAGRSRVYFSSESRLKIMDTKSYFLPGSLGILGFADVGRVWDDGQHSVKWHPGYGAGLFYLAYNRLLISATMAFSPEETLFNLSIGTKFNLNF